jgi:catechol 2,3-dioxygenase-like lactoylglutathione lyase family enzyme
MHWIRGLLIFVAGTMCGMLAMPPAAAPQNRVWAALAARPDNASGLRLNHLGIFVKNMDESKEFYTKKMGFREAFNFTDPTGKPVIYLQINRDTFLEMTPADAAHPSGFSHAGIWADDVKLTVASLKEQGVKVEDVHLGVTKAPLANLYDPNGVRIELLSYPPESLQRKAIDAWR